MHSIYYSIFQDSLLLTSVSLTERVKLWDKFTGPVDQEAIKLEFFRKIQRKNPPFRIKVRLPARNRVLVPQMIKDHYKKPVQLLPTLRDVLRLETVCGRQNDVEYVPEGFKMEEDADEDVYDNKNSKDEESVSVESDMCKINGTLIETVDKQYNDGVEFKNHVINGLSNSETHKKVKNNKLPDSNGFADDSVKKSSDSAEDNVPNGVVKSDIDLFNGRVVDDVKQEYFPMEIGIEGECEVVMDIHNIDLDSPLLTVFVTEDE